MKFAWHQELAAAKTFLKRRYTKWKILPGSAPWHSLIFTDVLLCIASSYRISYSRYLYPSSHFRGIFNRPLSSLVKGDKHLMILIV